MEKEYFISIYLDTRRALRNKKYPVKIRVFTTSPRKQKLYSTKFEFSQKEFESIWETTKPNNAYKEVRRDLQSVLDLAEDAANLLNLFSFEDFEKRLFLKSGESENVFMHYQQAVESMKSTGRFGTAVSYQYSVNSLKKYLKHVMGTEPQKLLFKEITPNFLSKYEYFMLKNEGRSQTTVGIYLRPLKALFNSAISNKDIKSEIYPFGKRLYQIPSSKSVKKALNKAELKQLFSTIPKTPEQIKAKDYWFFLFNAAGINVKDLALLRYENLHEDRIVYIREKTKRTSKTDLKPVVAYLNEYALSFIEKNGNFKNSSKDFIFPILDDNMSDEQKFNKIKNFTKFINQNIKKLALANNLSGDISTYWSRHSFATNAIRSGASLEQISQALNHHDLSTTKTYFAGFEDDAMKKLTDNLMNF